MTRSWGKRHSWMPFDRGASGRRSTSGSEQLRVHGNTAIVMGHETVVDTGPVIRRRYTEVWIRAGERRQAVARHANEIRVG